MESGNDVLYLRHSSWINRRDQCKLRISDHPPHLARRRHGRLAMLITHTQLSTMSVIAVLMLIGIVKRNAIPMVDFALVAEQEDGLTPPEAICEAALAHFRPITMATLVAMGTPHGFICVRLAQGIFSL
jgi:Cu/Ag efflux pump CusA